MQCKAIRKPAFWEHFEHEADMGIRGVGQTKEQAFEQAAMALTAVITEPDKRRTERKNRNSLRGGG